MLDYCERYVLNNSYTLFYDVDRYLIGSKQNMFFTPIHPMYAKLFSFFNGSKFSEIVSRASKHFSISSEAFIELIKPFVDNPTELIIKYDGCCFKIPPKIIEKVDTNHSGIRTDVNAVDEHLCASLNLERIRLSIPKHILFVVNTCCVTDCIYCYADKKTNYELLPTKRILEIIDEAHKIGVTNIDLSGGEFLLHKDWELIVKRCKDYGYLLDAPSTKIPLSHAVIDKLKHVGLTTLQVSLDSVNSELLQKTLNVPDDYCQKIKESIRYIDEKGISLIIKGTQTKYTCDVENIRDVMGFIGTLKNVKRYTVSIVGYSHNKTVSDFKRFRPTKEQIEKLGLFLSEEQEKVPYEILFDTNVWCKSNLKNEKSFNQRALCSANVNAMVVLPDGKVTICEELYWNPEFIVGDLSKKSIMDVWTSDRAMRVWNFQQEALSNLNPCKSCSEFQGCRLGRGVCWKSVIAHYGENNSHYPDPACPKAPTPLNDVYYEDL